MDASVLEKSLRSDLVGTAELDEIQSQCRDTAKYILKDLRTNNSAQANVVVDNNYYCSACCPRRSGKTYCAVCAALITGESKPYSITLVISLNLKQLKKLYWDGGPSGIHALNRKYKVGLEFNSTDLKWTHRNGSIGYLMGTDKPEQVEQFLGMEADLYIIDECKSFAPGVLEDLLENKIEPQRSSRKGKVLMIGTPGSILTGPFYKATCPQAVDEEGKPYLVPYKKKDPHGRETRDLWSFHSWTLQDNKAKDHQWDDALRRKRNKKWADDDPTWLREYCGKWALSSDGLVSRYLLEKPTGKVTWVPARSEDNPTGLPKDRGPWRLVAGLDLGYESDTAFVVAGYSTSYKELRHVFDVSVNHLLPDDVAELVLSTQQQFGKLDTIFVDHGNNGGAMLLNMLIQKYGLPAEKSIKQLKHDGIELQNSGFARGEIKIIEHTELERQLSSVQYDLESDNKENLARRGKLEIDRKCKKDAFDAFLYLFRGTMHHYSKDTDPLTLPAVGTKEWEVLWNEQQLAKARKELTGSRRDKPLMSVSSISLPMSIRRALAGIKLPWETDARYRHGKA
jgi:hypothetical protein